MLSVKLNKANNTVSAPGNIFTVNLPTQQRGNFVKVLQISSVPAVKLRTDRKDKTSGTGRHLQNKSRVDGCIVCNDVINLVLINQNFKGKNIFREFS